MLDTSARPETVLWSLDLQREPAGFLSVASRFWPLGLVAFAALVVVGGWYAAQVIVLDHSESAAINASVAQAKSPLRPDATLQITASGAGVELTTAQLFRADVSDDGTRSAEQPVPVRLEPTAQEGAWQVVSADGASLLRPDGAYRLAVRVAAPRPALPVPRTDFLDKQYRFATVPSPHARVPSSVLQPRWAE